MIKLFKDNLLYLIFLVAFVFLLVAVQIYYEITNDGMVSAFIFVVGIFTLLFAWIIVIYNKWKIKDRRRDELYRRLRDIDRAHSERFIELIRRDPPATQEEWDSLDELGAIRDRYDREYSNLVAQH